MNFQDFRDSLGAEHPPSQLSLFLQALWYDGKGHWEMAHTLIQDDPSAKAALIHAYLHRKEGDIWNADYWYRRAGRKRPNSPLEKEWEELVKEMST